MVIMNFRTVSIFVVLLSLVFLGCVEQKPAATPAPTAMPTVIATETPSPTVATPVPTPTPAPRESVLYFSEVDELIGFWKVVRINGTSSYTISNHTLTINAGDTVKWVSASDANEPLTLISMDGLWDNSTAFMKYQYRSFNYTFTRPGTYDVYLKGFPKVAHQKIIVNP